MNNEKIIKLPKQVEEMKTQLETIEHKQSYFIDDGNGITDTLKFNSLIEKVKQTGKGKIIVNRSIDIDKSLVLCSGVIIEGVNHSYSSPISINLIGDNKSIFSIGNNVREVTIKNIKLTTQGNNNIAIKCEGEFPQSSFGHVFKEIFFTGFDKCISMGNSPLSTREWQCDNILIQKCYFAEGKGQAIGIYTNTQNTDYIKIDNCTFTTKYNIFLEKSGFIKIDSCAGMWLGGDTNDGAFLKLGSAVGNISVNNCQSEHIKYFLETEGVGNTVNPISLNDCIFGKCLISDYRLINLNNCQICEPFEFLNSGADSGVIAINCTGEENIKAKGFINDVLLLNRNGLKRKTENNLFPLSCKNKYITSPSEDILAFKVDKDGLYKVNITATVLNTTTFEIYLSFFDENKGLDVVVPIQIFLEVAPKTIAYNTILVNLKSNAGGGYFAIKGNTNTTNSVKVNCLIEKV